MQAQVMQQYGQSKKRRHMTRANGSGGQEDAISFAELEAQIEAFDSR